MMKQLTFIFTLMAFVITANSQSVPKWKIEEVVKSYSAKNDTVYVVNFWATFCKPCIEEIPDFIRIVEKYKTQKVKLLLVSLDLPTYYPDKITSFVKKNNYNTNIVWLNETNADHFCPLVDVKWSGEIPSTMIINNKTGYRKFFQDQVKPEAFEAALKAAIGGNALYKFTAPMNDAEVMDHKALPLDVAPQNFVTFRSADSAVYSIMDGKVNMIAKIDHMKVVIIEKDKLLYTYSNLGSTSLKTGDLVKANQLIGFAAFDLDGFKPTIELYVSDAEKNISLTKADFANRKDKN